MSVRQQGREPKSDPGGARGPLRSRSPHRRLSLLSKGAAGDAKPLDVFAIAAFRMLKDPLHSIETFSRFLTQHVTISLNLVQMEALRQLVCSARELHARLPGILNLVPLWRGKDQDEDCVDVNDLLSHVKSDLSEMFSRREARLSHPDLPRVRGNPSLMRVLFENLVVVSLRRKSRRFHEIRISSGPKNNTNSGLVTFVVFDGGEWLSLFEFHERELGTRSAAADREDVAAMGLMLVRSIVDRHGGRVWSGLQENGLPCLLLSLPAAEHVEIDPAADTLTVLGETAVETSELLVEDCLATLGHDLRTPACTIVSSVDVLLEREGALMSTEQRNALKRIQRNSSFMLELLEDLLDTMRLDAGRLHLQVETCDIRMLLGDIVEMARLQADQKSIRLVLSIPSAPVEATVDPSKMRQVVQNLVSNALKFTKPGGAVEVGGRSESSGVTIWVRDTGLGIPESERASLFKKFSRTSVRATLGEKSTGLGLFISSRLVRLHGGEIEVQSTPGEGSTFRVLLPSQPAVG